MRGLVEVAGPDAAVLPREPDPLLGHGAGLATRRRSARASRPAPGSRPSEVPGQDLPGDPAVQRLD